MKTDLVESGEGLRQNDITIRDTVFFFQSLYLFVCFVVLEAYQPFGR